MFLTIKQLNRQKTTENLKKFLFLLRFVNLRYI